MKISRILPIVFFVSICSLNAYSVGRHFAKPRDTTYEILITGHQSNGKLVLQDASGKNVDTLNVQYDDDIIWTNTDPGIIIEGIKEKSGTGHHFKYDPTQDPQNSKKWDAKVAHYTDNKMHISKYYIKWKDSNGEDKKYDPLIRINPNQLP